MTTLSYQLAPRSSLVPSPVSAVTTLLLIILFALMMMPEERGTAGSGGFLSDPTCVQIAALRAQCTQHSVHARTASDSLARTAHGFVTSGDSVLEYSSSAVLCPLLSDHVSCHSVQIVRRSPGDAEWCDVNNGFVSSDKKTYNKIFIINLFESVCQPREFMKYLSRFNTAVAIGSPQEPHRDGGAARPHLIRKVQQMAEDSGFQVEAVQHVPEMHGHGVGMYVWVFLSPLHRESLWRTNTSGGVQAPLPLRSPSIQTREPAQRNNHHEQRRSTNSTTSLRKSHRRGNSHHILSPSKVS